ncbi:MAG: cytochrome P450 [Pseudomonadales bacterium]|nr:cytochrome P450 [Pseudomonadales bacterium]
MSDVIPEMPEDAYANYETLRRERPVSQEMEGGPFMVALHADVMKVLRDQKTFSSDVSLRSEEEKKIRPSMLFSDPPVHNRLRKLVSYAFKPGFVENQRKLIEGRCEELVEAMCQHRQTDLVEALAAPLPVTVIAYMLGVVEGDMRQFKAWSDKIFSNIADILFAQASEEVQQASAEMDAYFLTRIAQLREHPEDNLLGRLVETETEDGKLTDQELLSFCGLLLIAGNETTTGLITGVVRMWNEMPETFAQVKANPALIPTFIEETLRFHSPFSATIRRTTCDTRIGETDIPAGSLVIPLIASANRDEAVFERADQFVIDRHPNPHVAFGFGIHNCLGAHLARLEGEIAVASLTRHLKSIRIVGDVAPAGQLGGPSEMLVELEKA